MHTYNPHLSPVWEILAEASRKGVLATYLGICHFLREHRYEVTLADMRSVLGCLSDTCRAPAREKVGV